MNTYRFIETFSTPIQFGNLQDSDYLAKLHHYTLKVRDNDPEGRKKSNILGYQSSFLNDETAKQLMRKLHAAAEHFLLKLKFTTPFEIKYDSPWVNINGSGHSNKAHRHGDSDFSACVWVQANEKSGAITFVNPNPGHDMRRVWLSQFDKYIPANSGAYNYVPRSGDFAIFPGDLYHEVGPNMSSQDRISIAFNFDVKQPNMPLDVLNVS